MVDNAVTVRLIVKDDGTVELKRFQGQVAATKAEVEGLGRSGMSMGQLFDTLDGKTGNLSTQMGRLNASLASASGTLRHNLLYGLRDITLGLTAAAGAATYFGLKAVNSFQHTQAAFSVLTGSMQNGQRLYNQLMALNLKSPFDMQPLASSAQTLLGFGFNGTNVLPLLRNISNVASVQQDPNDALMRMALAVGQINQSGVVRAQDLNQLVQAGLPAYSLIPGGHQGLISGQGTIPSSHFINQLANPNNPQLARYGGAAQAMNQTLSGQLSNLSTEVRQTAINAFQPMANALVKQMPGLTRQLQADTKKLAPDISTFGMDLIQGAEHLLPVLLPIVHSMMQGIDKMMSAGGPFLRELQNVDPQITSALDDFFTALAGEEPQLARLFGNLLEVLPPFIRLLGDVVTMADPLLNVLNVLLGFKPLQDIFAGLLFALLAYKTLDGPIGAIIGLSRAMTGLAASEEAVAAANVTTRESGGIGGVGAGAASGKLGKALGVAAGLSMLFPGASDVAQGKWSGGDDLSTILGGTLIGASVGGPFGALAGAVLGGSASLGVHAAHWLHGGSSSAAPPPLSPLYGARLDALQNDPRLRNLLARGNGSINVQTGAITVHASPGMDETKLAAAVRKELDNFISEQQNRGP